MQKTHPLLQRYPAVISLVLLLGAFLLTIASFNASILFPIFALSGTSPALPCLVLACVLGVSGTLTSIISILEYVDRAQASRKLHLEVKEHRDGRN